MILKSKTSVTKKNNFMQSQLASTVTKQRDKILFLTLQLFWALDRIVARLSPARTRRLAWFTVAGTA